MSAGRGAADGDLQLLTSAACAPKKEVADVEAEVDSRASFFVLNAGCDGAS